MSIEKTLRYTKEHEWVLFDAITKIATIGITNYAQESLGDVVFVEFGKLPKVGEKINAHHIVGSVESVKTVSDIYAPVSGEVIAVNEKLKDKPELINEDVYGDGWMFKIKLHSEEDLNVLMNFEAYQNAIL